MTRKTLLLFLLLLPALLRAQALAPLPAPAAEAAAPQQAREDLRWVAVGDVHGDLSALRRALHLAGLVDKTDNWTGGATVLVQTGDFLDRGPDEVAILDYLEALAPKADAAGGAVHGLMGNHEFINLDLIFPYVTKEGFAVFNKLYPKALNDPALGKYAPHKRGRVYAMRPGGPFALRLSRLPVFLLLGDTLFVHGGLSEDSIIYGLDRLNDDLAAWGRGETPEAPPPMRHAKNPVWLRDWSRDTRKRDCPRLHDLLQRVGATRMVVGHTVQGHINSFCKGAVWRIDTGNSQAMGGRTEVLVYDRGTLTVLPKRSK
jgi:hypothetical protein